MMGELNPFGYHLVNNLLHSVVSCCFFYLCKLLLRDIYISLYAAVMFALHPIHTGNFLEISLFDGIKDIYNQDYGLLE